MKGEEEPTEKKSQVFLPESISFKQQKRRGLKKEWVKGEEEPT